MTRQSLLAIATAALLASGCATIDRTINQTFGWDDSIPAATTWAIDVDGDTDGSGVILFDVVLEDEIASRRVLVGVSENASAGQIANAIGAAFAVQLPETAFSIEPAGERVTVAGRTGTPAFQMDVISSSVPGTRVRLSNSG